MNNFGQSKKKKMNPSQGSEDLGEAGRGNIHRSEKGEEEQV
jgi:hypothetical protein